MSSDGSSTSLFGLARQNVLTIAGVAGAAVIAYAIYFDHKRRSAPDYKDKIRQKRREAAQRNSARPGAFNGARGAPDVNNPADMQAFFLQEVQLGEELMASGNREEGAVHICNALALCGQPQQLLAIFQQTLPPEDFQLVIDMLPQTRERLQALFNVAAAEEEDQPPTMQFVSAGGDPPPGIAELQGLVADDVE